MDNTTLPAEKLASSLAKNLLKVLSISDDPEICEEFQHLRDGLTDDEVAEQLIERLTPFIERGMMVPVTQMKAMMKKMPIVPTEDFSADSDDAFSSEESPYNYFPQFICTSNENSRESTESFQIVPGDFSQESDGETAYFPMKQPAVEAEFTEDEAPCGPVEEFSQDSDREPGFNYQCQPLIFPQFSNQHPNSNDFSSQDEM